MASGLAITSLFALIYAVVFVIGVWFLPSTIWGLIIMIAITVGMVLFQYAISPLIVGWLYRIDWIPYEEFASKFPHLADSLNKVVEYNGIKMPRLGIIHDLNPNAFTYGWSKNSARVILTDGILHYLNKKEQNAVFSHELGHVVHSDFILMTVVFAIPLVLLTVARWAYYASYFSRSSRSDSDEANYLRLALIAIAVLSYISYYLSYLISLIVSRIREYYADEHSAEVLEDPNALATGLVKIAYGLLADAQIEERKKSRVRALRGFGIFDPSAAKGLGVISVGTTQVLSMEAVQKAAAWDLYNPWAKYYQMFSTHPLPAKRIMRLNMLCDIYGIKPEIDFSDAKRLKEEQAGKTLWDQFLGDIFMKMLPTLVFLALLGLTIVWLFDLAFVGFNVPFFAPLYANMWLAWAIGFYVIGFMSILKTGYMYKGGFEDKKVLDLVTNVKVSPIRTVPAFIEGKIVGKGIPGYYFSEDMYFQDDTGLMYVDYRFGIGIVDLIFSLRSVNRLIGQNVRIKGWYRRGPIPYIQVDTIWSESGRRHRNYSKAFRYLWAVFAFILGIVCIYFWFQG
ncbi:MAG: M48 family metalloprotease [Promethearchaeota archaeon]|nr:MAG: M48 family metalloprotease [Candidatus Lokiarchaeota archaeon]